MPPVIGAAAIGLSAWAGATLTGAALIAVQIGIAVVASVAAAKVAPKPKGVADRSGRTVTAQTTQEYRRAAVGRPAPFAGQLVYFNVSGDNGKYLWQVIRWVDHVVDGFEGWSINGVEVTPADIGGDHLVNVSDFINADGRKLLWMRSYDGSQTTVDPDLSAAFAEIDANFVGNKVAYTIFRFEVDDSDGPDPGSPELKVWADGIPQQLLVTLRGAKMHDTRDGVTRWSRNPSLAMRYLVVSWDYGPKLLTSDVPSSFVSQAADVCDEDVTVWADPPASGTVLQDRYTCDGLFTSEDLYDEILDQLASSMFGRWFWQAGQLIWRAGAYVLPDWTLDESTLASGDLEVVLMNGPDSEEGRCNAVRGSYFDPLRAGERVDFLPRQNSAYQAEDSGQVIWRDIDLPFTANEQTAQRIALLHLKTSRRQQVMTVRAKLGTAAWGVMDTVTVNLIAGLDWSGKVFEVVERGIVGTLEAGEGAPVIFTLRETAPEDFEYVAPPTAGTELDQQGTNPTISDNPTPPPPPDNLTVQAVSNGSLLNWTSPHNPEILYTEVYRSTSSGGAGEARVAKIDGTTWTDEQQPGTELWYRVANRGRNGGISSWEPASGRVAATPAGHFQIDDPTEYASPVSADYVDLEVDAGAGSTHLDGSVVIEVTGITTRVWKFQLTVVRFIPPSTTVTVRQVEVIKNIFVTDDDITQEMRCVCDDSQGEGHWHYSIRAGFVYLPSQPASGVSMKIRNQSLSAVCS